jgi:hypothetical protein
VGGPAGVPPRPDPADVYGSLRDEPTRWLVVHVGTLLVIGLLGAARHSLTRDLPGPAAQVSRVAAGAFVLFYGVGGVILSIAVAVGALSICIPSASSHAALTREAATRRSCRGTAKLILVLEATRNGPQHSSRRPTIQRPRRTKG